MPTIEYKFEPLDEVYFIDYCEDIKTEAVVKGTIYRIDFTVRKRVIPAIPLTAGVVGVDAVIGVEQVPSEADIIAAQGDAANILNNTLNPALITLATAQTELQAAIDARDLALTGTNNDAERTSTSAAVVSATLASDNAQAEVDVAQDAYDAALARTVITTVGVDAIEAVEAVAPTAASDQEHQDLVVKYVIRTNYNQQVCIEDENLIFENKTEAFDLLETRVK